MHWKHGWKQQILKPKKPLEEICLKPIKQWLHLITFNVPVEVWLSTVTCVILCWVCATDTEHIDFNCLCAGLLIIFSNVSYIFYSETCRWQISQCLGLHIQRFTVVYNRWCLPSFCSVASAWVSSLCTGRIRMYSTVLLSLTQDYTDQWWVERVSVKVGHSTRAGLDSSNID